MAIKTFANTYLDVPGASRADRAQIIQYRWNGGENQRFRLVRSHA
ncbi:RICIN domain-containing protein [Streptomyces iconiensis]|uniref:RICIN domain-containing protein n=1 Tax=Streptomyces iconiensis TaxID=1384038 RepID=A0ABT6ZWW9_9ACTN|nr:RICIN domain-containing protein [Streptomyces iconiensis]MDJ1133563.1 RICIN domain-containing protein [Streptomyces iconiensis]